MELSIHARKGEQLSIYNEFSHGTPIIPSMGRSRILVLLKLWYV